MNGFSVAKKKGFTAALRSRETIGAPQSLISGARRCVLGAAALGSGAALLAYILARASLVAALAFAVLLQVMASLVIWSRASPDQRQRLSRTARVGLVAGVLATATYDLTKFALSHLDSTVFNPFEAIRMFGVALVGRSAPTMITYFSGAGFHVFNGVMFGIAFAFFLGQRGILAGIAWGLFLEGFQLTFFPGWLNIKAYQEFTKVSAVSHLVYGSALGLGCQRWLR